MSDSLRELAEERADRKIEFYKNLKAFIVVNAILAVINALFFPDFWWVLFPIFFWSIGVLVDFLKAFVRTDKLESEEYREKKIQEEMEKLRK